MKRLLIATALLLSGCATEATRTQTVEVKVPVATHPITVAQVPKVPDPLGKRPQSLSAAADQLLAKHCQWVAYALLADPLLRVSAGASQLPLPAYPECEK
jgi:type IV pilus biogenesis protein CpaD/CtpE